MERWTVRLPPGVSPPYEVYVNGVRQQEGADFERRGNVLLFAKPLVKAGKLGFWKWAMGAFGVGTYDKDDQVDVRYEAGGRPYVAQGLDIEPPGDAGAAASR
jgi:hypothetical protein